MLGIYLLFYQGVLLVLTTFNMCLQREEPLIYQLFEAQERFMNKLAARFIKSGVIQKIKTKKKLLQNLIFLCKIKKTTSILEFSFSPSEKWTTFWKRRYFSRSFWQILLIEPERFFKSLPILCKVVTTEGFPSSTLKICWFWSEKYSFVWFCSTYSWIFWYHKSAINRTSRVIKHVGGRLYRVPSHDKSWRTTAHLGWIFR